MTLDPNIRREAQDVLKAYTNPAQELIKQNLYGPREARFAGAIVANSMVAVEVHEPPPDFELLCDTRQQAWDQISALCDLLEQLSSIVEERVGGEEVLLKTVADEIVAAEENFEIWRESDSDEDTIDLIVVILPAIEAPEAPMRIELLQEFADKLRSHNLRVELAEHHDQVKRLSSMTVREIYSFYCHGAVVIVDAATRDVLHGWFTGLPWVDEVLAKVSQLKDWNNHHYAQEVP